jgi:lactoylglutathione lyase
MQLGAMSVSLAVKDINKSAEFYQKLGFEPVGGDVQRQWLILRNGEHTLGLFQGMFDRNLLTFNPGWDAHNQALESFTDVREIQQQLLANRVSLDTRAEVDSSGPASIMLTDPDGNPVLIDQHI